MFSEIQAQVDGVSYDWKEQKNKQGISIYTSKVEGSKHKAVRGEMIVNASVASLFSLTEDSLRCAEWAEFCKQATLEKRISDTESYVYIYNDIPFPVKDRDVYSHVVWSLDKETQTITMTSNALAEGKPDSKAVRITTAYSQWHFTPNQNGSTKVESFAHIDPNGPTPAWITNMLLVDAPFKTMSKMRDIVEGGDYANSVLPTALIN